MVHRGAWPAVAVLTVCLAMPASAQVLGMPVVNNGAPIGVVIGADYGSANDEYADGGGTAVGGHATFGAGMISATAALSRFAPESGAGVWSPGGALTLRLLGGPLVPFRITLQGGVAHWSINNVGFTHIPVSLGLAATIPNPAFAIKPWIAPRLDIESASGGSSQNHFGMSGGIDLALLNGMALRAAYDRVWADGAHPSVFSVGIGFSH